MNDDEKELGKRLKEAIEYYDRNKIAPIDEPQSLDDAIQEGNELLKKEEKSNKKTKKTRASKKSKASKENPYVQAREQLLEKMDEWKRKEILNMEKSKDTDNKFYIAFVKEVRILGDTIT